MVGGLSHGFVKQKKEKKEKGDFFSVTVGWISFYNISGYTL
jgi:hypothetical protein